jgi:serine/threonine protein kinase
LHQNKISHRDMKIENIMKGEDGKWKICDFGSCTFKQYN